MRRASAAPVSGGAASRGPSGPATESPRGKSRGPSGPAAAPAFAADVAASAHLIVADLADEIVVHGPDGHHLARVRRLHAGEVVTAADGDGSWRTYAVTAVDGGRLWLGACGGPSVEPEQLPGLEVAFASTKGSKPERVVAQLVELGVDRVLVFVGRRSVVRLDGDGLRREVARLGRVAREAAMQSRRARVPAVGTATVDALAEMPGLVVADRDGVPPAALGEPPGGVWTVVVGPEGGLDPEERARFGCAPIVTIGRFVLRADTAAPAIAAALSDRRTPHRVAGSHK